MMILGLFFRHIGWMDEEFASKMNKFVFKQKNKLSIYNLQIKSNRGRGFFKKTPVPLTKKFLVYIKILLFEHVKYHTFDSGFC